MNVTGYISPLQEFQIRTALWDEDRLRQVLFDTEETMRQLSEELKAAGQSIIELSKEVDRVNDELAKLNWRGLK